MLFRSVTAFIPLVFGLYWKRATTQGAYFAMIGGLSVWLSCEVFVKSDVWLAQIVGFAAAFAGMIAGSLLPQKVGRHTGSYAHAHGHQGHEKH